MAAASGRASCASPSKNSRTQADSSPSPAAQSVGQSSEGSPAIKTEEVPKVKGSSNSSSAKGKPANKRKRRVRSEDDHMDSDDD